MMTTPTRHVPGAGHVRRSADGIGWRHRARRAARRSPPRRRRRGDRRRRTRRTARAPTRAATTGHPHSTAASSDVVVALEPHRLRGGEDRRRLCVLPRRAAPGDGAHRDARRAQRHPAPLRAVRLRRTCVRCGPRRGCRGSGARRARGRLSRPAGDAGRRAGHLARQRARRPRRDQCRDAGHRGCGGDRRPPRGRRHGRRPLQPDVRAGDRAGRLPVRAAVPLHLRGGPPLRDALRARRHQPVPGAAAPVAEEPRLRAGVRRGERRSAPSAARPAPRTRATTPTGGTSRRRSAGPASPASPRPARTWSFWRAARMFALVNMALYDSYVAGWDSKFHWDFWRPYTAIRAGDTDGNRRTVADPAWLSHLETPPVQDYPSTHSASAPGRRRCSSVPSAPTTCRSPWTRRRPCRRTRSVRSRPSPRRRTRTPTRACRPASTSASRPRWARPSGARSAPTSSRTTAAVAPPALTAESQQRGQRPRCCERMPFMLVGTGPLGIGMLAALGVERLEALEDVGHLGGLDVAAELLDVPDQLGQRDLALAVAADDLVDRDVRRRPARACVRSVASSCLSRLGLPSPTRTMPGGPTTRCTTSCCLLKPTTGSTFQPRRSICSAAAAAPAGPPSGCTPPSGRGGRRRAARRAAPNSSAPTIEMIQPIRPVAGQHPDEREAERGAEHEGAEHRQADARVGLAWPSGRSAMICCAARAGRGGGRRHAVALSVRCCRCWCGSDEAGAGQTAAAARASMA